MKVINKKISPNAKLTVDHLSVKEVYSGVFHLFISTNTRYPYFTTGGSSGPDGETTSILLADEDSDVMDFEIEFEGNYMFFIMSEKDQFHLMAVERKTFEEMNEGGEVLISRGIK